MGEIKQPDNMNIGGRLDLKLIWNPNFATNKNAKLKDIQRKVDSESLRYMIPYMPFNSGALIKKTIIATKIGSGEIVCPGPESHYLYMGEVYGPNIPIRENGQTVGFFSPPQKHPTGEKLVFDTSKNPLAGPFWFERMAADHKSDILKEAQEEADR